ncbi:RagB/SusD family nutrient uptake outer membrane protein [Chryseobacterium sp. Leaf394]|uniref:RagB/SusD family nutrient uptake outer membrane protein n=1 Tax=Chryseobacterium sp. Leaf394 TaxID=1736361 RepID=UPI0006FC5A47|nr:RagB/SusD family nutrient uptake outer membrane protein [Chryseobacterium sp. Leaf394]KQS95193.1 SusD/RagB family protein [Chryseobacterium sp. Leaf394]
MKNTFKTTVIAVVALFSVSSCNDALDIIQDGEMPAELAFQTTADLDKYLNGAVYSSLDNTNEIFFSGQFTDELGMGPQNSELQLSAHQFYLDVTNPYASGIWISNYSTINRVNRLLDGAKKVTPASADVSSYNNILAQARVIRAFNYFTLLSYFSTDMKSGTALGVMVFDNIPMVDEVRPRVANSEVFAAIDADIAFAETNLTVGGASYLRVTRNMLNAFKARYYLYRGMYPQAKTAAEAVLSGSGLSLTAATPVPTGLAFGNATSHGGLNALATTNPYKRMWVDTSQGEIIFALSRPTTGAWGNIGTLFNTNQSNSSGSVLYDMGRKTYNLLSAVNGDIRRFAYLDHTSTVNTSYATIPDYRVKDVLIIDKYPGKTNQTTRNDLKVFRLSEIYFILAECAVEEGDFAGAATRIKAVRDARNYLAPVALPVYTSKAQAYTDILLERRKELYLEGHRYLDLKRLGETAGVAIDRDPTDDLKTIPVTIPITDYRMKSLPIPRPETQGNPTIVQNPGY